jgi:hypothetical protein
MPRTCLAAFLDGEVKNVQHGLADDPDMTEEGKASPAANEFVLPILCGGGVDCCCSSSCRKALRCSLVAARRWKSDGLLWLPSPELGSGGGGCKVLKAEGGVGRLASGIDSLLLAAAEGAEPFCEHAGPGEGKAKSPVRAGFREIRGTTVPLPMDAAKLPQLAVDPIGVSGFFGEANNVLVLVGVSGPSDGAANTKPPFAVGPVAVGVLGAAKNAKTPVAGFGACPGGLKNDDETLLDSDPAGVLAALPANLNMFPREAGGSTRNTVPKENSLEGEGATPAWDAIGEGGGGVAKGAGESEVPARSDAVGEGGRGGVDEGEGATSKGASSSSILLRTEEPGTRQWRLRPAPLAAAHGAEKATAEGTVSMRSSARCRGGGVRKKSCGSAAAMTSSDAHDGFLDSWGGAL